jgi:molybdenum cofactor cytidylyltransferase
MKVAIVILAAGKSSRTGVQHKLLAEFAGRSLIRRSVLSAAAFQNSPVVVVTGYRGEEIEAEIADLPVNIISNDAYGSGMASSLSLGVATSEQVAPDGIMIMLADMPEVKPSDIGKLVQAFFDAQGRSIVRATSGGMSGHPVIFPASLYADLKQLTGDKGARQIIEASGLAVINVDIGAGAILDVDTAESVAEAGGRLTR